MFLAQIAIERIIKEWSLHISTKITLLTKVSIIIWPSHKMDNSKFT